MAEVCLSPVAFWALYLSGVVTGGGAVFTALAWMAYRREREWPRHGYQDTDVLF